MFSKPCVLEQNVYATVVGCMSKYDYKRKFVNYIQVFNILTDFIFGSGLSITKRVNYFHYNSGFIDLFMQFY